MNFILPYFIILLVLLQLILRKNGKKGEDNNKEFWHRESKSNTVRRKDISHLAYITIPDTLPQITTSLPELITALNQIEELRSKKILNLSGKSNTDLKMEYGAPNLTELSSYDDNFTRLLRALTKAGNLMLENNMEQEGIAYLEYSVQIGSDISDNYTDLATYYVNHDQQDRIKWLIQHAEILKSIRKDAIITKVKEISAN